MRIINFNQYVGFISKEIDLPEFKVKVLGYFPYEKAKIGGVDTNVAIQRVIFSELESTLRRNGINDNKIVVIFQDPNRFSTENFAIQFKDCVARVGKWYDVRTYQGEELILKPEYNDS